MEYWLIDTASGHAQGCYLNLDDALLAAEVEVQNPEHRPLSVLCVRSVPRESLSTRTALSEPVFVRWDVLEGQPVTEPEIVATA